MKPTLILLLFALALFAAAEPGSFQYEIIDSGVWKIAWITCVPVIITIIIVAIVLIIKTLIAGVNALTKTQHSPETNIILSATRGQPTTNPRKEWRE